MAALTTTSLCWLGRPARRGRAGSKVAKQVASDDEAAAMQAELKRVRAQVMAMEEEAFAERRQGRARELLSGVTSRTLDTAELRGQLKQVVKMDVSEAECAELLTATGKSAGSTLSLDDLASEAFDTALEKLASARREAVQKEKAAKAEAAKREAEASQLQEQVMGTFTADAAGGASGPVDRLLACLVYLLPLVDGIQYGLPLAQFVPGLIPLLSVLSPFIFLKTSIPFGTLIFLIGYQYLAGNPELSYFLRFNLQQAAVMDVLFILPALVQGFVGVQLPESLEIASFVILFGCIAYAVVLNALGKIPDGLGFISDAVRKRI